MNFRTLKYFVVVAQELNIGRAATRLNISQPPLTRQIQQLEASLGVKLFNRSAKGVELTNSGELLLEEAQNILTLVEQAEERTKRADRGELGRLDVGIFGSAILDAIPKLLLAFRQAYPDVNIILHALSKEDQIEALRQRRITVGFNRFVEDQPDIASEVILHEPIYAALPDNDPLVAQPTVTLLDLASRPFVLFPNAGRPNFIDRVLQWCQREGFSPRVVQEVGDAVAGIALVASGFGVCLVSESATTLMMPRIVYRPVVGQSDLKIDLSCLYRRNDQSPILQAFLGIVRRVAAES